MQRRELFGGAIEVQLPQAFVDISNFRQVPDHQEVFADGETDASFIFEILEHQSHLTHTDALNFYWNDLADANEATDQSIQHTEVVDVSQIPLTKGQAGSFVGIMMGEQSVAKGKDAPECSNQIQVDVGVVRLIHVKSDLVFSLNSPLMVHGASSSGILLDMSKESLQERKQRATSLFKFILESIIVKDWVLFG